MDGTLLARLEKMVRFNDLLSGFVIATKMPEVSHAPSKLSDQFQSIHTEVVRWGEWLLK